jgi:hypothetical protein
MKTPPNGSSSWQYALFACLLTAPVWGSVLSLLMAKSGPSGPPGTETFVSKGLFGNGIGEPYLKKQDGHSYRLLCPSIPGDRHRRACFVGTWPAHAGTDVVVIHRKPVKRIVDAVEVCNVMDAAGNSLLTPQWAGHCK